MFSICAYLLFVLSVAAVHSKSYLRDRSSLNSGVMKLIIKAYIDELLSSAVTENNAIREKLMALSDHVVNHPALYQRHLYVGDEPPAFNPFEDHRLDTMNMKLKRQMQPGNISDHRFPSEESCATDHKWKQINRTYDDYNNSVEVVQLPEHRQFVYTIECINPKGSCRGISPFYHSECVQRHGWMLMWHKKNATGSPQWGAVSVPHSCACKIQEKPLPAR